MYSITVNGECHGEDMTKFGVLTLTRKVGQMVEIEGVGLVEVSEIRKNQVRLKFYMPDHSITRRDDPPGKRLTEAPQPQIVGTRKA